MEFWGFCTEIDRERRPFPPCALRCFEFTPILYGLWFVFGWIRFSIVNSWARDERLVLDDFVTLWSDSNTSSLVLQPLESRVHSNRSSWRSRENPVLAREFLDSSQTMEWFVDSFRGYVHKSFVIMPAKFELLWTWFVSPIIEVSKDRGLKKNASGLCFSYHRLNRRLWYDASDQPVSRFLAH